VNCELKTILTIAGSDSSAGAGIQQDLKTITALGEYGATVITAVTSQNTLGVQGVMPLPASVVKSQLEAVLSDLCVSAVKIGMIPNREVAEAIVESLKKYTLLLLCKASPGQVGAGGGFRMGVIYDPVMVSSSGTRLMSPDCVDYVVKHLFPLCTLVTPNLPEWEVIKRHLVNSSEPFSILCKGGHAEGEMMTDTLYMPNGETHEFSSPRITTANLHGTGCTLSSAIATYLAKGESLPSAVAKAKEVINRGIEGGRHLSIGKGNGPLWLF
jgi:hydroxymethylpyrimidine/phosphomethylpyrimidine kinase